MVVDVEYAILASYFAVPVQVDIAPSKLSKVSIVLGNFTLFKKGKDYILFNLSLFNGTG